MDIYKLYRNFWDWSFENPEKIKPNAIAIYSFAIEHCNRLGWKKKFGLPSSMVMEAIGIRSYNVYKKHLDSLVENGFIIIIEKSYNQYSSNIIALNDKTKANDKAQVKPLDKAFTNHRRKQRETTGESNDSINKQLNNITIKQLNNKTNKPKEGLIFPFESEEFKTAWGNWVVYKKGEYNFKYKTLQSEQGALMKLSELSKNENEAIKIIHESIANGWKGFFKLKNENNDKTNNSQGIYSEEFKQKIANGMVS
ncbi:hypothetical protein N8009_02590 [Flavobacteriaceae bacterium]|nr:hypothetical protein [Flavobacteriaceae bacterium]